MLIKRSHGQQIFEVLNITFMVLFMFITLYPLVHIALASVSDPVSMAAHRGVLLKPYGFTLEAYKVVLSDRTILSGYVNTIFYVLVGTSLNLMMTILAAYALSRKNVPGSRFILLAIVFTMQFRGGLIPTYLTVRGLGLYNSWLAIVLPVAMSAWNFIIMRTSFAAIPESMEESAKMDGANDYVVLFKIIIPLAMPVIAVMVLFYGVQNWNSWFSAMIYLRNRALYPLQLVLREIIIQNQTSEFMTGTDMNRQEVSETIKYATIMVSTIPILCLYPFLQRYFVKGVMVGAVKG